MKRATLFCALAACSSVSTQAPTAPRQSPKPPNILFILADDHGYQAVSAYGHKINSTPNIDRLAKEGMLFHRCFVTNSLCGPARATILTGKYSHKNGFYSNSGDRFDGSQDTFPKLLQRGGYQTAIVGKWHLETDPTGFDYWHILPGQGQYYNPPMIDNGKRVRHEGYVTEITTDLALNWLKGRNANKPFLLMCHHKAPHREWEPALKYLNLYMDTRFPEPSTLFDDYSGRGVAEHTQDMTIARTMNDRDLKLVTPTDLNEAQRKEWEAHYGPRNEAYRQANLRGADLVRWKYQEYMKDYLRCIASIDEGVGRLLDYLDQSGLAKDTIVVYSSDQGFYLGEHGWFDKRWIFEQSLRAPLLVRWPGVTPPWSENGDMVSNLDFAQTFLDAAGVQAPPDMQGASMKRILTGAEAPLDWRKSFYYHYYEYPGPHNVRPHYGVVTDRYTLVHFYSDVDEWELFDNAKDPLQMKSVYGDPAYQEAAATMRAEMERLQKQYGDTELEVPMAELRRRRQWPVPGKVQLVLRLDKPDAELRRNLDPSVRPLTVGALCVPKGPDGAVLAQGGATLGYSLYLKDAVPRFAVRIGGKLKEAVAKEKLTLGANAHLAGGIGADGALRVYVNGEPVATSPGEFLPHKPGDPLSIGRDTGSPVGEYQAPFPFQGELSDIRIYWGELGADEIRRWAEGAR